MEGFENQDGYQSQTDYYSYGQTDNDNTNAYGEQSYYRPYEEPPKPKKEKSGFGRKLMKCVALALVFGLVAGTAFAGTTSFFHTVTATEETAQQDESLSGGDLNIAGSSETVDNVSATPENSKQTAADGAVTDVSGIVSQTMPSIVSITTIARTQVRGFFGRTQEYESEGCGSGIIVSQDDEYLYIATNNHVVSGAETLTVLFCDDSTVSAEVKGTDESSDLAVVAVALEDIEDETKDKIRTATFGDSSALKVGETAIAIGNALGYGQSVTTGVISALNREVSVQNESDGSTVTNELLQTDAAINPGNSGGALLNLKGEVIGINSVKYSETSVEGMGYAIPSASALPIIKQLITREVVSGSKSAYLGISGVDVTDTVSDTYQMPQGVYVAQVIEGSGAANAGLQQGDIITKFDGRNITSMEEMQGLMKYLSAGDTVNVTIERAQNGEYVEMELEIVLGSKK